VRGSAWTRCAVGAVIAATVIVRSPPVAAHEPLDLKSASDLLLKVGALQARSRSGERTGRAVAAFELGETIQIIVAELNRDLAAHGGQLGLSSKMLVEQLGRRNIHLSLWPEATRFRSYVAPYESCLDLDPEGTRRADALLRVLQGRFYDSFRYDPLQTDSIDWPALAKQIEMGETLLTAAPDHREHEEATFIVAVNYLRATRLAPTPELVSRYADRARQALEDFARAYPDSMRATAAQVLVRAVPPPD